MRQNAIAGLYNSCQTNQQRVQSLNLKTVEKTSPNTIEYLIGSAAEQVSYSQQDDNAPAYHIRN